jgi:hypothetical protein
MSELKGGRILQIIPAPNHMLALYRINGEEIWKPIVYAALTANKFGEKTMIFLVCDGQGSIEEIGKPGFQGITFGGRRVPNA